MNDPHVAALNYRVRHGPEFDYTRTESLRVRTDEFDLQLVDGNARFAMLGHHATEREARASIDDYIRSWELASALECGPNAFKLEFDWAEIEDRKPTPGVVLVRPRPIRLSVALGTPQVIVAPPAYPSPPLKSLARSPDVESMYLRYAGHHEGREPLTSMAYFCLTVLEASTGKRQKRLKAAAKKYCIDQRVLTNLRRLASTKGGVGARKAEGLGRDLTPQEQNFLQSAVRAIIRRAAEVAHDPDSPSKPITLRDLPAIQAADAVVDRGAELQVEREL